jgi:hypothetical protein
MGTEGIPMSDNTEVVGTTTRKRGMLKHLRPSGALVIIEEYSPDRHYDVDVLPCEREDARDVLAKILEDSATHGLRNDLCTKFNNDMYVDRHKDASGCVYTIVWTRNINVYV